MKVTKLILKKPALRRVKMAILNLTRETIFGAEIATNLTFVNSTIKLYEEDMLNLDSRYSIMIDDKEKKKWLYLHTAKQEDPLVPFKLNDEFVENTKENISKYESDTSKFFFFVEPDKIKEYEDAKRAINSVEAEVSAVLFDWGKCLAFSDKNQINGAAMGVLMEHGYIESRL